MSKVLGFFVVAGAALLAAAALAGQAATGSRKERRCRIADRRQRSMPATPDQRVDIADRRGGAYAGA